jgi:hypothetical protein
MTKTSKDQLDRIYEWMKNNPEKVKATRKKYKEKHAEEIREQNKKHYPEIKDRKNERRRARRRLRPDFVERPRVYTKEWKLQHPGEYEKIVKDWKKSHYEKNKEILLDQMHNRVVNLRLEVLYWYSDGKMKCEQCGESRYEFLAIDHINNDGTKDRKEHKGNIVLHIIRSGFPNGYQVLCHNCNALKQFDTYNRTNPTKAYHRYRDRVKIEMVKKYSGGISKCVCCGESRLRCLTFHHVNGGGTKHVRSLKNKSLAVFLYKNSPPLSEFSVLCFNCNKSLGQYGFCPHNGHDIP